MPYEGPYPERIVRSCLICGGRMRYAFAKGFDAFDLATVEYCRCDDCAFVLSDTHARMSDERWNRLNVDFHAGYQGTAANEVDPRWIDRLQLQADMLLDLHALGVLKAGARRLDYGCGDGKLAELLRPEGFRLHSYDRYMAPMTDALPASELRPKSFDFVITTSVFEHLTRREQFDEIAGLVADDGVLGVHTMVCEEVPKDPSWFYLLPVHCAFHTNAGMRELFRQWGYRASIYDVQTRLYLWFKDPAGVAGKLQAARGRPGVPDYLYADGFLEYWK